MHRTNNKKIAINSLKQPQSTGLQNGEFCSVVTQVVSHRAFTAEAPVRSRAWAHEIGGVQMNISSDFSLSTSVFLLLVSFHLSSICFFILIPTLLGR